jgi:hypothetical protein
MIETAAIKAGLTGARVSNVYYRVWVWLTIELAECGYPVSQTAEFYAAEALGDDAAKEAASEKLEQLAQLETNMAELLLN